MSAEIHNDFEGEFEDYAHLQDAIETLLNECLERIGRPDAIVDLTFVGEDEIQSLNREYRQVDAVTDVLSFALEEGGEEPSYLPEEGAPELLGDIIICVPRALEQASEYGHSNRRELGYLAVHGLLHLIGYDHLTPEDQRVMREKEEELLGEAWGRD